MFLESNDFELVPSFRVPTRANSLRSARVAHSGSLVVGTFPLIVGPLKKSHFGVKHNPGVILDGWSRGETSEAMHEPRAQLSNFLLSRPSPNSPLPRVMTTPEHRAVGDIPTDVAHHAATTTVLNTEIKTLSALNATIVPKPLRAVFESVIVILTLVRVSLLILFLFLHQLIGGAARTR